MPETEVFHNIEDFFTIDNCLALLLMKKQEKPGVLIMSGDHRQKDKIKEICSEENWYWRVCGGSIEEKTFLDKTKRLTGLSSRDKFESAGIFVCRDPERFKILESSSGGFYGFTDSAVGDFLGYEDDAVEFYGGLEDDETAVTPYEDKVEDLLKSGDIEEDELKYLELVFYVPVPDREHVMEAVETGMQRWNVLSSSETGRRCLELLERQL